mmetsp:Transcript_62241/g.96742  ORF Transcript_62241/g.96742 Transcript_62241/m.96742 type:complete len:207 (+) Transcript_62241:977-1597(+)
MSLTAGRSFTDCIILKYCEPCPGKSNPIGNGLTTPESEIASFQTVDGAPSNSSKIFGGFGAAPPYLDASKPFLCATPGRLECHPFCGLFFPHSQPLYIFSLLVGPSGTYQPYGVSFSASFKMSTMSPKPSSSAISQAVLPSSGSFPYAMRSFMCGSAFAFKSNSIHSNWPACAANIRAVLVGQCKFKSPLNKFFSSPVAKSSSSKS